MPANTTASPRTLRNNPYVLDNLIVTVHRSAAGTFWRWRTELAALVLTAAALWRLALLLSLAVAAQVLAGVVVAALVVPGSRRFTIRRFWCVLTRHRLQRLCWEARLHTRAGRLPLVLWTRPTKVGERAHLLCRAGICAEDFEARTEQIRAACYARDARITRHPRWSQLVTIDVIRRDTLAAAQHVPSLLTGLPVPAQPGPGDDRPAWPALVGLTSALFPEGAGGDDRDR